MVVPGLVVDKTVRSAGLYRPSPLFLRLDVSVFVPLYAAAVAFILQAEPLSEDELSLIRSSRNETKNTTESSDVEEHEYIYSWDEVRAYSSFGGLVFIHLLCFLACYWSVKARCFFRYKGVKDIAEASVIAVYPAPHCGSPDISELRRDIRGIWFEFQRQRYCYVEENNSFSRQDYPTEGTLESFLRTKGYQNAEALNGALMKWGKNEFDIPMPPLDELFVENALSPFFLFQVFCVALWCLDEYWYYSVFTLLMLVVFELTVCKQRQTNLQQLRLMRRPPYPICVYREGKWRQIYTSDLLPGDICSIVRGEDISAYTGRGGHEILIPCDLLLLRGQCIVNEAMLTGESVPNIKESVASALKSDPSMANAQLDIGDGQHMAAHAKNLIMGGTNVLQHSYPDDNDVYPADKKSNAGAGMISKPPDKGCIAVVLRTGYATSQGSLVRTILFSTERVGVDNIETYLFILILLCFAIIASAYVLYHGLQDERQNKWKLFLHCTMIITSVVPPELPMELSLAVTTSLARLQRLSIFCTEPYRIPFAGKLDVCCFDKTGTLTSDNMRVNGIAELKQEADGDVILTAPTELERETTWILAACHQLIRLGDKIEGDTSEKAVMKAIKWSIGLKGRVLPRNPSRGRNTEVLDLIQRNSFSSALKRMSVIVAATHLKQDDYIPHFALCKGAPEVLENMFAEGAVPKSYSSAYNQLMREGKRVLALGFKEIPANIVRQNTPLKREDVESELTFGGLLVLDCPLKEDTAKAISQLQQSRHRVVVITGDNPLTAIDVAMQLDICNREHDNVLLLQKRGNCVLWRPITAHSFGTAEENESMQDTDVPFDADTVEALTESNDLVVSGGALAWLEEDLCGSSSKEYHLLMKKICPYVTVFARVVPRQKEKILAAMKAAGLNTLMCGDGTNDVGALKQADIGVSIINSPEMEKKLKKKREMIAKRLERRKMKLSAVDRMRLELQAMEQEERESGTTMVQLGDASIASPFTSRSTSISSTVHIVLQGRCTLVTTIQMFKILALNCLISAYSLTVLYLYGVKQGDTQATIAGLLIAILFMMLSYATPLEELSVQRPISRIFCFPVIVSLIGQFIVHISCLLAVIEATKPYIQSDAEEMAPDADFKPNVINTAVFLIGLCMQVNVFSTNYRGRPFMQSLMENKSMHRILGFTWGLCVVLTLELIPGLGELLELVPLPSYEYKMYLFTALMLDTALVWLLEWGVRTFIEFK